MIKMANELAKLDCLVVFQTTGSGTFNADARRLLGLQQHIPIELTDSSISFFHPLQKFFDLTKFGKKPVKVSLLYYSN